MLRKREIVTLNQKIWKIAIFKFDKTQSLFPKLKGFLSFQEEREWYLDRYSISKYVGIRNLEINQHIK